MPNKTNIVVSARRNCLTYQESRISIQVYYDDLSLKRDITRSATPGLGRDRPGPEARPGRAVTAPGGGD
jgi:hypothetical protein